ncbi:MAG: hypothetical protein CM1200mP41_25170 [Gammaproteobacteria bacterium]|nr:MAG: hypothetical protein CM1200mP41_25170 [Gammaproteobacteria bacterium]
MQCGSSPAHDGVIVTDQTVFYPEGGGQPGDTGWILRADGGEFVVTDTQKDAETGEQQHHVSSDFDLPAIGETVTLKLDWDRRYRLMRMHSCMHMLCAVIPAPVTGGSIQDGRGRLDFDLPEPVDKEEVTERLNVLIAQNASMQMRWISDEELAHKPELVRTMSVKPPTGSGQVRIVEFEGIDIPNPAAVLMSLQQGRSVVFVFGKLKRKVARIVVSLLFSMTDW